MKLTELTLLLFAVAALANPIAEAGPVADDEIAGPILDELVPRQVGSGCTVTGSGGLNVYHSPSSTHRDDWR